VSEPGRRGSRSRSVGGGARSPLSFRSARRILLGWWWGSAAQYYPTTLMQHINAAPQMVKYRNAKRGKRRVFKSRSRAPRKVTKGLRRTLKSIVRRAAETKMNQETPAGQNIFQGIDSVNAFNLIPAISQGTGQANRIGNKIMPIRFVVRLAIICANANNIVAGASPTYFDIYIFKWKPANQAGAAPDMGQFLQNDNTANFYNGGVLDGLRVVNSDCFNLLYKKRILLSNITNSGAISGVHQTTQPCKTLYINMSKHCKKTWLYNDTSNLVTNDNMYIAIGATQANGDQFENAIGSYQYYVDFQYKDI